MSNIDTYIRKNKHIEKELNELRRLQNNETIDEVLYQAWQFRDDKANITSNTYDTINNLTAIIESLKQP